MRKPINKFFDKFSDKAIWILIFIYIFLFSYICFLKYHSFNYYDIDFASDIIVYWNSLHGKFLYFPFLEESIFGAHFYLIVLLILPVYALFQHPVTILFLQSLFLGLAAYPLYLLGKSEINKTFALIIGLVYLMYPPLGFVNLFETHFDSFTVFFLAFAIYYFHKEKFGKFMVFILLALSCKENVSLVVTMFGLYALLRKRSKKWILTPFLLGVAWFILSLKFIIPYFAKAAKLYQEGFIFSIFYKHLGRSWGEILWNVLTHPLYIFKFIFTPRKILYLYQLFVPVSFIGLLSPGILLMTLPVFAQNLLSTAGTHADIHYQYVAFLIPFIFSSVIFAFKKLLAYREIYNYRYKLLSGFVIVSIAAGFYLRAPQFYFMKYINNCKIDTLVEAKNQILKMIPEDASVIATFQFLPKLAHRHNLYSMHFVATGVQMHTQVKYNPPDNLEYALIDFNEPLLISSFFPPQAPANIENFLKNGNWKVLEAVDDIVLFKKNYREGHDLCEFVRASEIKNLSNVNIDNRLIFLGYDIIQENKSNLKIMHFIYYWKRTGETPKELGLFIRFDSKDTPFNKYHVLGYRTYQPDTWPEEKIVKEHHFLLIPSWVKPESYQVKATVFNLANKEILPVSSRGNENDPSGEINLGTLWIN